MKLTHSLPAKILAVFLLLLVLIGTTLSAAVIAADAYLGVYTGEYTTRRQELREEHVNVLVLCPAGMVTTQENIDAIRAQGFWGDVTTNPLEIVARKTIDRALAGRAF